jgi:DNA-binding transcriptional LysR family regulator
VLTDPRIHSFLALCTHGTTTAAAAATNRALSTISTHVSAIETRLGAALFKRAHGVFTLTELGEEVRAHAETIVAAEEAILATARLIKQGRQAIETTSASTHYRRGAAQASPGSEITTAHERHNFAFLE